MRSAPSPAAPPATATPTINQPIPGSPTELPNPNLDWLSNLETESKEVDEEPDDTDEGGDEPDEIQVTIVTTEEYTVVASSPEVAIAKIFSPGEDEPEGVTLIGRCVQANGHDHPTYPEEDGDHTEEA